MKDVFNQKRNNIWYGTAVKDKQDFGTDFRLKNQIWAHYKKKLPSNIPFQIIEEPNQFMEKFREL